MDLPAKNRKKFQGQRVLNKKMANYWKKNLFLLCLGPLSVLLAWALGFIPNPRPLYRGIGGGTSNGMNYWEHIERMYGNQTRPDFCLIQNVWGDSGPFPLTCYQKTSEFSSSNKRLSYMI